MDYHNEKAAELRQKKRPISKHLDKNLLIMNQLVGAGQIKTLKLSELISLGFNQNVFTHLVDLNGKMCRCIYQFIIPPAESPDTITIINQTND
jgi:hypothetical protein